MKKIESKEFALWMVVVIILFLIVVAVLFRRFSDVFGIPLNLN